MAKKPTPRRPSPRKASAFPKADSSERWGFYIAPENVAAHPSKSSRGQKAKRTRLVAAVHETQDEIEMF
jgi:hypothetical protein